MVASPPGPARLIALVARLDVLAERRAAALDAASTPARERAAHLRDHVRAYLIPRARSLDLPLLVLVLGPTGAGKSSLVNALAGAHVTDPGILRPTTREAVIVASQSDARALAEASLAGIGPSRAHVAAGGRIRPGIALVDAPDLDSVETANRALADRLTEAADLAIFVTSATRYADRVPWHVLERIRDRGLPLVVVVNRLPPDRVDAETVLRDVSRLVADAGLPGTGQGEAPELVPITEGAVTPDRDALASAAVAPLAARLDVLAGSADARRELAATALRGALAGLAPQVHAVADDVAHEAIEADALRRAAALAYDRELAAVLAEVHNGRFLREEVLRQWQSFVGADQVTALISEGLGRIQATIRALIRGIPPAPVAPVRAAALSELLAAARERAAEAARRTAEGWNASPAGHDRLATDAGLWTAGPAVGQPLRYALEAWLDGIAQDVRGIGARKRPFARGATFGVNAAVVAVMLGIFVHTGGLTGAEMGVTAATAVLNQKLLAAIFGEAAVARLIDDGRARLDALLAAAFADDRGRFERLAPDGAGLHELGDELRELADAVAAVAT